jgi:hypothetical protein
MITKMYPLETLYNISLRHWDILEFASKSATGGVKASFRDNVII